MGKIKLFITLFAIGFVFVMFLKLFSLNYTGYAVKEEYNVEYAIGHLEDFKNLYNANINKMPNFIKSVFGNERINAIVQMSSGRYERIALVTKGGIIEEAREGALDNPTIIIGTKEEVINSIMASAKPAERFRNAMLNKEITLEAISPMAKVKMAAGKSALKITSWFSGLLPGHEGAK